MGRSSFGEMSQPTLWPCKTCGEMISPLAKACPKCGAPSPHLPPAIKAMENVGCILTGCVTVPILALLAFGLCAKH